MDTARVRKSGKMTDYDEFLATKHRRATACGKAVLIELKESYFDVLVKNMMAAEAMGRGLPLLDMLQVTA